MGMQTTVQENTLTLITPSPQHVVILHSPVILCLVQMVEPKFAGQIPKPNLMVPHVAVSYIHLLYHATSYLYIFYTANN
jgi:hypothetical protein